MRFACDEKVHAMAKERHAFDETIQNLTKKLEGMISNEKEGLQKKREIRATRTSTKQHELQQNDKQIHELQEQLYEARQKAITAQEEVQAKTAQVKQYKKKDDQREEKVDLYCNYHKMTVIFTLIFHFIIVRYHCLT